MKNKHDHKRSLADLVYDAAGTIIPSCESALRMVEIGQRRPLTLKEKIVLMYNTPLCPHCNCNREKFIEEKAKMVSAASRRTWSIAEVCFSSEISRANQARIPILAAAVLNMMKVFVFIMKSNQGESCKDDNFFKEAVDEY